MVVIRQKLATSGFTQLVYNTYMIKILDPKQLWVCPSCKLEHVSNQHGVITPLHPCSKFGGVMVPFVLAGQKAGIRAVKREDYLNGDTGVMYNEDGEVIMSVITEHDDGYDTHVFPGAASIKGGMHNQ